MTSFPLEYRTEIDIDVPPAAVFDYVSNPHSWPEWLASSHELECDNRPMALGDTFHEHWSTRSGPVELDWVVLAADRPAMWLGLTETPFTGPIVVQYDCRVTDRGTHFVRTVRNPQRPKAPTDDQLQRMQTEGTAALARIKANLEGA